jgi:hypothetical protein
MNTSTAQKFIQRILALVLIIPPSAYAAGQGLEARRAELDRLLADEWQYTLRTQPELVE